MAAHRPIPPLIVRSTPSPDSLRDPGAIAWEILRRRADYQTGAGQPEMDRSERDHREIEFLTGLPPDPRWGLQFRGRPRSPGRECAALLASKSRSVSNHRRCGPDRTRRQRRLRPFRDARADHASVSPGRGRTSAFGQRPTFDPAAHRTRHTARRPRQAHISTERHGSVGGSIARLAPVCGVLAPPPHACGTVPNCRQGTALVRDHPRARRACADVTPSCNRRTPIRRGARPPGLVRGFGLSAHPHAPPDRPGARTRSRRLSRSGAALTYPLWRTAR
ncbi:hypothetical protein SAMN03159340_04013 [Sphingomonas sp. NFR15]|nr:hypothetical protein SAMN03159340_04013 [Sphingomonas sp. NFR15]